MKKSFLDEKAQLTSKMLKAEIDIPLGAIEENIERGEALGTMLSAMTARIGLDWKEIDIPEDEMMEILRHNLAYLGHNLEDMYVEEAPVTWSDALYDYVTRRASRLVSLGRRRNG